MEAPLRRHIEEGLLLCSEVNRMKNKAIKKCDICGTTEKRIIRTTVKGETSNLCYTCYQRIRRWGEIHPLPPKGEIQYDVKGKPICHVCGHAFNKLLSHVWQVHGMTEREYKTEFSLLYNSIMSEESTENAREGYNRHWKESIEALLKHSEKTRFVKGHPSNGARRVCLQRKTLLAKTLLHKKEQ